MEILIAIGLLLVLASIGVVSYRSTVNTVTLRTLKDKASLFLTNFESCIASSSWKVDHPLGTTMYPCSNKEKVSYVCSQDVDNRCEIVKGPTDGDTDAINAAAEHICLDLGQKVRGKNYQVYIIINIDNTAKTKLVCKESGTSNHSNLTAANCKLDSSGNPVGVSAGDNKCDDGSDDW